jgi:hypothetical protein
MAKTQLRHNADRLRIILDRAISQKKLKIYPQQLFDGRTRNKVEYIEQVIEYVDSGYLTRNIVWRTVTNLKIYFTPDTFNQKYDIIELNGRQLNISHHAYKKLIRRLSEWEVMNKLEF